MKKVRSNFTDFYLKKSSIFDRTFYLKSGAGYLL
ncbi:unknown [[Mannheimia] succiniciproducens MBEL55E]|uniref:Uncharacterized protein n=1 Tax=Mannheimia succiniciproducens (strain KCTC 0769BP / MBEL55E) TaxID=221988 RepID=Q65U11_MANSM|nr:unknown [[Mannheimia] succiniciproducens MBEL55E]